MRGKFKTASESPICDCVRKCSENNAFNITLSLRLPARDADGNQIAALSL